MELVITLKLAELVLAKGDAALGMEATGLMFTTPEGFGAKGAVTVLVKLLLGVNTALTEQDLETPRLRVSAIFADEFLGDEAPSVAVL